MLGLIDNTLLIFSQIFFTIFQTNATFNNLIHLGAFQPKRFYLMKKTVCFFCLTQYKIIIVNPIDMNFNVISNLTF